MEQLTIIQILPEVAHSLSASELFLTTSENEAFKTNKHRLLCSKLCLKHIKTAVFFFKFMNL